MPLVDPAPLSSPDPAVAAARGSDRAALAAAILLFTALALFGGRYHWVEEAGTAERDGYVAQAEAIRAGHLPHDPFRPPLYPLLVAGLSFVAGDAFAAARLISNAAAAALAWLTWRTGRRLAGAEAGGWAMALAAVNPNLWILGQHATTDMLFGALGAWALDAGLAYRQEGRARAALGGGLAAGLAAATRGNALFLLPGLLAAWWLAPGRRRRLAHLAAAAGVAALAMAPVWALRQAAFGSPFHDENWKNLAWKLHGYPDWSYLERVPYRSGWEVIASDPAGVVRGGFAELGRFAAGGLAQLLGTWAHVLLCGAGAAWALRRRRGAGWLLAAGGLFLAAVAFSFFTWGRLLLLLIPACYALGFSPWSAASSLDSRRGSPKKRLAARGLAAALVALLAAKTFAFRLPDFVSRHPYREVAAIERLAPRLPPGARLAGTSPFLGRYLADPGAYLYVPDAFGREATDPALYLARLHDLLARQRAAYLIVGAEDLRDRPAALAGEPAPAPWLALAARQGRVSVWRVLPDAGR